MSNIYCFDLDGTITKEEILPILSKEIDLFEEISALTEATIKGIIPFQKSFLLRCRLLSEIPITRVQEIIEGVQLHEEVVSFIRERSDECFIITGNLDVWVAPLIEKIGCRFFSSTGDVENNHLIKVSSVINKMDAVKQLKKEYETIVAIGDGMGDVSMFEAADVGVAFGGTHNPIQSLLQVSDFVTYKEDSLCRLLNTL